MLWVHLIDPVPAPFERLFLELYVQGLQGRPHAAGLLDGIVEACIGPVSEIFHWVGLPMDRARDEVRLAVVVTCGLLLDVLATGDRAAATRAFELHLSSYEELGE